MTRTLLSIAIVPALFLATLSLVGMHHRATPEQIRLPLGPRLVTTIHVVSFVYRWEPVEEIKPPPPELPAYFDLPIIANTSIAPASPPPAPPAPHAQAPHRPRDVCARYGGHRVDYRKSGHLYWRCAYPHRA